ncbi:MAG: hypothetical protein ABI640_09170 [Gammaproteobacteria bacterium]
MPLKKKHAGFIALGISATAYAIYVAVALHGALASLRQAGTGLAAEAAHALPAVTVAELRASAPRQTAESRRQLDAEPISQARNVPSVRPPAAAESDAPAEDINLLKQRALLDVAAHPEFADLLNAPDPEVRKAMLDFFE